MRYQTHTALYDGKLELRPILLCTLYTALFECFCSGVSVIGGKSPALAVTLY